jgi:hypothetical protein
MHVAESAKYLWSLVHCNGSDRPDVLARIKSAKSVFGCLRRCLFSRRDVTYKGKRKVYEGLVLAILLYRQAARSAGVLVSARERGAGTTELPPRLCPHNVSHFDVACWAVHHNQPRAAWSAGATDHGHMTYLARRQLQWLGHVCVADGMVAAAKEAAHSVGAGGGEVGGRA